MLICAYCPRTFRIGGLQEQLSKLYVHVISRHANDASENRQDWYREEAAVSDHQNEPKIEPPVRDAGDVATQAKWQLAAQGVMCLVLSKDSMGHVGVSGLSPQQMRELACAAIKASYDMQAQVANVNRGVQLVKP